MGLLQIEQHGRVVLLTFNDPNRRNVVSAELNDELEAAFDQLEADPEVGALVITGAGKAFCAGAVLDDLLAAGDREDSDLSDLPHIYRGFLRVAHSSLPIVAAVNGAAIGAGMNMVLACDLIIAGRSARFDSRFLTIGIHPGGGHTWRLRNISDLQTAKAMVLFNQILDGEEAARRGLIWECVDDDQLISRALHYARSAASHPRGLLATTKTTLHATAAIDNSISAVELEVEPQRLSMRSPEFLKTLRALREKIGSKD